MGGSGRVLLDVTELIRNPLRTGIQRIEREIIRHWPGPAPLVLCHFDKRYERFVELSGKVVPILTGSDGIDGSVAEERARLEPLTARGQPVDEGSRRDCVLNAELFFDPARAIEYIRLSDSGRLRLHWIVADFLPFLHPEYFPGVSVANCMHYLRALRAIPNVGYISEGTRSDCMQRILRRDTATTGPVFSLGGDGLALPRQSFDPGKRAFLSIGTIEPRKNVGSILEAFENLWQDGLEAELILVGRMLDLARKERRILERLTDEPRLRHFGHVSDEVLRSVLARARATIFVSRAEGFGLPPLESLAAGIPVIVAGDVPSIRLIPPGGQIQLASSDPSAIAAAVLQLMDDGFAANLWREAAGIPTPTWRGLAEEVGAWVQA